MPEEIFNKIYIAFPTTPNLCAPTLPCNTSGKSDYVHVVAVVSFCARRFFRHLIENPDE